VYRDRFAGAVDAPRVHLFYDWCGEGRADADFTFAQ
jgi:hypothetical protein